MPQRQTPPKFFITHSHNDNKFAKRLCDDLRANGLDGFFDVYSLHAGDDIASQIARGLEECDIYIPVLSPVALQSPWCELEVNAAITLSMERGRGGRPRIIPVIAEECRVPVLLHKSLCINFVGRYDDALNELLTKGLGWSPKPPSPPLPVLPAQPPLVPSSPMFLTQLRTWIVAGGGLMGVLVLYLLMAWITGRLDTTATVTPMHVVQTTAKLASPTSTTTPSSTPTATPTRTDTPTSTPTVTPVPATPTPRAGEERVIGGAPMVFVPAGEFLMGSSDAQAFKNDETPQHKVRLDAFWIDKFEVTNAQYRKCVDAGNCAAPTDNKSYTRSAYYGNPQYDNYPVIYVSWDMATTFCEWAGKRLPTEAEWEKAARGTDGRIYPWGNTFDATKVNSDDSIPRPGDTTAVGSYPGGASPYGAMDMAGNVVEWVNDFYDKDYYILSPRVNPQGAASGPYRVLRGGAYNFTQYEIATTYRGFSYVSNATNIIGFRCAQ